MTMIKVLENEFYYLDNFQRVLDWIAERYAAGSGSAKAMGAVPPGQLQKKGFN